MSHQTIQVTSFNTGGFEVKNAHTNNALERIRDYIADAFAVQRIDFMGIQEAGNKDKLDGRTFEVNDYFGAVVESAQVAILYNKKSWRPVKTGHQTGKKLMIDSGKEKRPITACLFERRGNKDEVVLMVNAWFPHVGRDHERREKAKDTLTSAMELFSEELYAGRDISAAFFTADFNEFFQRHHKETIPLFIDGQEHAMRRARRDTEKTFCNAGKDALHSGRARDVDRAEDRCGDGLGTSRTMGYMDGVYYWMPRGSQAEKPTSNIPGYQGSDHLPVECMFELRV